MRNFIHPSLLMHSTERESAMIDDITTMARALHDQLDTRRLVDRLVTVRLRTTSSAT